MSDTSRESVGKTEHLPSHVGRYRVLSRLGKGGFGEVFLALDDRLDRQVAIKVPNSRFLGDEEEVEQYQTEAKLVGSLDHPGIVPVYDVGSSEAYPFFVVSKYIDGDDLTHLLRSTRLTFSEAVELTASIADALQYAHKNGIVHRDVKPSNILVDRTRRAYLADFGLALDEHTSARHLRYAGTPAYMSPEQARGEGHRIDGRSDIFALGAVLYELLAGKRAFRGDTRTELREMVQFMEPRPIRQYDESLPREVERICGKALAKRARDRYQTAFDFAEDLRALLQSPETSQRAGSTIPSPSNTVLSDGLERSTPRSTTRSERNAETSERDPSHFDSSAPVVVPKGLHSFDENDADFFLELLPGARDRHGIPDQLRFWVQQIDAEKSAPFPVGMIYGPSGSGKSSFVKAGLLPLLSRRVTPVFVECMRGFTEDRILKAFRQALPDLDSKLSLAETFTAIRRGRYRRPEEKVLLVLDQFEQWLNMHRDPSDTDLLRALRQCDGVSIQVIVLIRSDFWMSVTRFFEELEVDLQQGTNLSAVDLFPPRHAEKVLIAFGQALGALPNSSELNEQHFAFIRTAVKDLVQNGTVICIRLAVYAEMMKNKAWTAETLAQTDGFEGVGSQFLEESFGAQANPRHRIHEEGAKAVLNALLPEPGTVISSQMKSYDELFAASAYQSEKHFKDLLRILDNDLRLVSPTDPSGLRSESDPGSTSLPIDPSQQYFRLTHDYLVSALRNWLLRKQKETPRGRAQILLDERASYWNQNTQNRFLPSMAEHLKIRTLTSPKSWVAKESRMMGAAARYHGLQLLTAAGVLVLTVLLAAFVLREVKRSNDEQRASDFVADLRSTTDTASVLNYVSRLKPYAKYSDKLLLDLFAEAEDGSVEKLHFGMVLAHSNRDCAEYLTTQLPVLSAARFPAVMDAVSRSAVSPVDQMVTAIQDPQTSPRERLQAACALARSDSNHDLWQDDVFTSSVADQLTKLFPSELVPLRTALSPASGYLTEHLKAIFLDQTLDEQQRAFAAESFVEYSIDAPTEMANFLLDSDDKQFNLIFDSLEGHYQTLAEIANKKLGESVVLELGTWESQQVRQHANAAIALYRMGQAHGLWPMLDESKDPTLRNTIIHYFASRKADPKPLIERLEVEENRWIRKAILFALGEYDRSTLDGMDAEDLVQTVTRLVQETTMADVRAAGLWFLKEWEQQELAEEVARETMRIDIEQDSAEFATIQKLKQAALSRGRPYLQRLFGEQAELDLNELDGFVADFPLQDTTGLRAYNSEDPTAVETAADPGLVARVSSPLEWAVRTNGEQPVEITGLPNDSINGAFTISVWVRMNPWLSYGSIVAKMDNSLKGFDLWQEGEKVALHVKSRWVEVDDDRNEVIKVIAKPVLADGNWHHITATYDGSGDNSGVAIYVNGQAVGVEPKENTLAGEHANDGPLLIGGRPHTYSTSVSVAELKLFNKALDAGSVEAIFAESIKELFPSENELSKEQQTLVWQLFEKFTEGKPLPNETAEAKASTEKWLALHRDRIRKLAEGESNWHSTNLGHVMVHVDAQKPFIMGSGVGDAPYYEFERQHERTIGRIYAISATEVTVGQFKEFLADPKNLLASESRGRIGNLDDRDPNEPMTGLTWFDAVEYCHWLTTREGYPESEHCFEVVRQYEFGPSLKLKPKFWLKSGFRLPTQAEWEFACRAGTKSPRSFGRTDALLVNYAWHMENAFNQEERMAQARQVALLKPNGFGLSDMHGNAIEWCIDLHSNYSYGGTAMDDAPGTGEVGTGNRTQRGGGYYDLPVYIGSGHRNEENPSNQTVATGFRVIQTLYVED